MITETQTTYQEITDRLLEQRKGRLDKLRRLRESAKNLNTVRRDLESQLAAAERRAAELEGNEDAALVSAEKYQNEVAKPLADCRQKIAALKSQLETVRPKSQEAEQQRRDCEADVSMLLRGSGLNDLTNLAEQKIAATLRLAMRELRDYYRAIEDLRDTAGLNPTEATTPCMSEKWPDQREFCLKMTERESRYI